VIIIVSASALVFLPFPYSLKTGSFTSLVLLQYPSFFVPYLVSIVCFGIFWFQRGGDSEFNGAFIHSLKHASKGGLSGASITSNARATERFFAVLMSQYNSLSIPTSDDCFQ
jgi:hypothetical protein